MDLGNLQPVATFFSWAVHVIVVTGVVLFFLVAGWGGLMDAVALTARLTKTLLAYVHERTAHARDEIRSVREEVRSWKTE